MKKTVLGIIGGSGLERLAGMVRNDGKGMKMSEKTTPFGDPSSPVGTFERENLTVHVLSRHGFDHQYSPSEVNYQANMWALKYMGCTHVLAISAVGILCESISPGDLVVVDQLIDFTKGIRKRTVFSDLVAHVSMADPVCLDTTKLLRQAVLEVTGKVPKGATYVCIEGPQFSTRAESVMYRKLVSTTDCNNPDNAVIGMTACPEAHIARELGMSYALLALATDYDCWKTDEKAVEVADVVRVMQENSSQALKVVSAFMPRLPETVEVSDRRPAVMTKGLHLDSLVYLYK